MRKQRLLSGRSSLPSANESVSGAPRIERTAVRRPIESGCDWDFRLLADGDVRVAGELYSNCVRRGAPRSEELA